MSRPFCHTFLSFFTEELWKIMSDILVFIEHRNCVLNKTSLEAINNAMKEASRG